MSLQSFQMFRLAGKAAVVVGGTGELCVAIADGMAAAAAPSSAWDGAPRSARLFQNAHGKPERHVQRVEMESFFECADRVILLENPDRVIKHVDGDYDPPCALLPDKLLANRIFAGAPHTNR